MSMRLAAVGTDEGDIYLVTTEYASTYLASYRAHATPVYNIQWNNFIPTVFLSCAAEWTVKIWDMNYSKVRRDTWHVTRDTAPPAPSPSTPSTWGRRWATCPGRPTPAPPSPW